MKKNTSSTGRLKESLDIIAREIVFPAKQASVMLKDLEVLATLNEAHLIALYKAKLLTLNIVKKLLKTIIILRKKKFSALLNQPAERGSYLLFENYLTETLGMRIAGSLHVGRSRNDINATTFKLNLRNFYQEINNNLCRLRSTILKQAFQYMNLAMPIYSQYQVAQVGTYAYYLFAVEEGLARDQYYLKELFYSLDESPIGAASGCGTSFSIDRKLTASLLGFSRFCNNALDAVASRDFALRLLGALSVMGTTLCRIAQDYQVWTTQEFSFFELPDNLCGSSSMMPQKKNPYLFEIIKGRASSMNGMLVQALTGMHNVPFSNSVEVGTEAVRGMEVVLKNMCDILTLSDLLIANALPIHENFIKSLKKGVAVATGVTEFIVKEKGLPFRLAHFTVGQKIGQAISNRADPLDEVFKLTDNKLKTKEPLFWAHINEYGGGPGEKATKVAYKNAQRRLVKDIAWIKSIEKKWELSEKKLQFEIKKILKL